MTMIGYKGENPMQQQQMSVIVFGPMQLDHPVLHQSLLWWNPIGTCDVCQW